MFIWRHAGLKPDPIYTAIGHPDKKVLIFPSRILSLVDVDTLELTTELSGYWLRLGENNTEPLFESYQTVRFVSDKYKEAVLKKKLSKSAAGIAFLQETEAAINQIAKRHDTIQLRAFLDRTYPIISAPKKTPEWSARHIGILDLQQYEELQAFVLASRAFLPVWDAMMPFEFTNAELVELFTTPAGSPTNNQIAEKIKDFVMVQVEKLYPKDLSETREKLTNLSFHDLVIYRLSIANLRDPNPSMNLENFVKNYLDIRIKYHHTNSL